MINKPVQEKAISLPFTIDSYGNVNLAVTQSKLWADKVRSVIGTMYGERVMQAEFGTEVPKILWDTTDVAAEFIKKEIASAFSTYLPLLKLQSVESSFNEHENIITASVYYSLPNSEEAVEVVGIAAISSNRALQEENL
jgi:hypothetical protein